MTRLQLFEVLRPFAPDRRFSTQDVSEIDGLADRWGYARLGLSPSSVAIDNIKAFEGCKLSAYPDPGTGGDPWTIGWGSTGEGIHKGVTWTQDQADARLERDVRRFASGVAALIADCNTKQHEFDALVSFAYNVGLKALGDSTLLDKHCSGDKDGAMQQFARWNKAGGRVLAGLTRRREAEARIYKGLPS